MNGASIQPANEITFLNVKISGEGVSGFHRGKRTVFVPKEQIQSIEARFGSHAERPVVQLVFGIVLTSLGIIGVVFMARAGVAGFRWGLGFIFFGALGIFCLYEVMIRGYYLRIVFANDTRKIVFEGVVRRAELSGFIMQAAQLGYDIRDYSSGGVVV
jgi:hypothetical protein